MRGCDIMIDKTYEMTKMLENFYKSCNYKKFQLKYSSLLDSGISDDIKNYLRILNNNFLFLVDQKKAVEEYEYINLPTDNRYLQAYYFLQIMHLINIGELREAEDKLNKYTKHGSLRKEDSTSLDLYLSIYNNKEIKDIEKVFTLNNKIPYQNVFNAKLLMDYYYLRENERAAYFANYIKKQKTDFTETNNKADLVLSIYKK